MPLFYFRLPQDDDLHAIADENGAGPRRKSVTVATDGVEMTEAGATMPEDLGYSDDDED